MYVSISYCQVVLEQTVLSFERKRSQKGQIKEEKQEQNA